MSLKICTFHEEHDMETDTPCGKACTRLASQEIHWLDGRVSYACPEHGMSALDPEGKAFVRRVTRMQPCPECGLPLDTDTPCADHWGGP